MKNIITVIVTYILTKFFISKDENKENNNNNNNNIKDELIKFVTDRTNVPTDKIMLDAIKEIEERDIIPEPTIINPDKSKTLIIVDDIEYTDVLYTNDIEKIKDKYNIDVNNDYKIVLAVGYYAGYIAYKYMQNNKVDCAILDITLGHQLHVIDTWFMEMDGIDIAYFLKQTNPDIKFMLCTAHSLNMNSTTISTYNNKCLRHFEHPLEYFYVNKNSDRVEVIKELLYG